MGNPQQQEKPNEKRRDFGDMPELEDLLALVALDDSDIIEAQQWLEDNAPDTARKIKRNE